MNKLSKDAILIIMSKLDDKSILIFSLTDKYRYELCKNEDFWRNRLFSRFKLSLEEAKTFKESSWKNLYLSIIHYLSLANNDVNKAMKRAAKEGNNGLVNFFISQGAHNWDWGMYEAALGGYKDLVDFFSQ